PDPYLAAARLELAFAGADDGAAGADAAPQHALVAAPRPEPSFALARAAPGLYVLEQRTRGEQGDANGRWAARAVVTLLAGAARASRTTAPLAPLAAPLPLAAEAQRALGTALPPALTWLRLNEAAP